MRGAIVTGSVHGALLWFVSALQLGCLPGDTRPEPGSVRVTAAPTEAALHGTTTSDGWSVSFDRLLAALGAIELRGPWCNGYGEPRYTRLFDFSVSVEQPQKVALVYGLGQCDLNFELSPPEEDTLLGPGVTAGDVDRMRAEADDVWIEEPERTSVLVAGQATRGTTTKRFEWMFRMEYDIRNCEPVGRFQVEAGVAIERTIVLDPAELLRESAEVGAALRFDALAASDADGDGAITLEELDLAPGPDGASLADLLYESLVPRMAHPVGSGECKFELDSR